MTRLILASSSPSRRAILESAGVEPVVSPANVDEERIQSELGAHAAPEDVVATLARAKATSVAQNFPADVVVGCDSMLLLDGQLLGKPHDPATTVARWRAQAGKTGELLTGHCVLGPNNQRYEEVARTDVHFADAKEEDIIAYAQTGEPLECAGAFTLEALGGWFIDGISGDPSSVIGLSLPTVRHALYSMGLSVHHFWNRKPADA
ncbi:septum formation inhibitor Maf [Corynebacterium poyangense]|uniref:Nucleoside triphosphate pyrophosphatase n=1 Tax=Corynebacterium poyangense TaxID=2684405 RepID=A0A7H0SMG3_9CORY|nr:nucleoside triphosphate pyrophosphatase [Corynebacterium poyangense]MBZ8176841.1 septum formation inhibitor Maf [Corynebacterium poyangense]QNQ89738.1 septum formation inhibitor Maf [Corynebacterium poyangense]